MQEDVLTPVESIQEDKSFKRSLGLTDATMIVAGSMIGSGIFIVSADITRNVGSAGWLIAVWLITGFMTVTAALSYGELSAMFPKAGGQYVYLREAYNPLAGFLYGWSFFAVIQTATIAAVAVAFSRFTAYLIPAVAESNVIWGIEKGIDASGVMQYTFSINAAQILAIFSILLLTYTNTKGVKGGKLIQTTFTSAKLLALFGLIILGFFLTKTAFWQENMATGFTARKFIADEATGSGSWTNIGGAVLAGSIAAAMVGSIFSSDAWNNVTFIAGEIKNPQRNIGLSLFLGTFIVTIIYICANLMYLHVLPLDGIAFAKNDRVGVVAAEQFLGSDLGPYVIAVLIMISTFGCNNGLILAGARVYYTMAKDKLFFAKTGRLNKFAVPEYALWIQAAWASLLCLTGTYGELLTMISFVVVIFYILTLIGIFILRKKRPDAERPYRAVGYPVLPIIYIILALAFCIGLVYASPQYALYGLAIVLLGIPIYFFALARKKA